MQDRIARRQKGVRHVFNIPKSTAIASNRLFLRDRPLLVLLGFAPLLGAKQPPLTEE